MWVGLQDVTRVECEDDCIGEGTSGRVFRTRQGAHVVKLFGNPNHELRGAMEKILGDYNCVATDAYWNSLFLWPDGLVINPTLGIRVPAIPNNYRPLTWLILPKDLFPPSL